MTPTACMRWRALACVVVPALVVMPSCSGDSETSAAGGGSATGGGDVGGGGAGGGTGGGGNGCANCGDPCDLDGDGYESAADGCAGDDCDDSHPNCWDSAAHGCCSGDGLLFHSEFEGSVSVGHPQPPSQWRLPLEGVDTVTGYDWTSGFPEDPAAAHVNIQCLVAASSELVGTDPARIDDPHGDEYGTTGFVDAQIVDHPGFDGRTDNRVLFYHSWRDDPEMVANSRLQTNWVPFEPMRQAGGEIYVAFWLKLQPNLYEVHTQYADSDDWHSRWRNIMEWMHGEEGCSDADFRFSLAIETYGSEYAFWRLGTKESWTVDTSDRADLAPPVDQWFFLEVYTERHPTQGRLWVGIDGTTLFDAQDVQTMPLTNGCYGGTLYYQFLKMYGDLYNYEGRLEGDRPPYQFWQYYDGVRIHDRLPSGHCAIDSSCPTARDLR